jgi:hypothetical protein
MKNAGWEKNMFVIQLTNGKRQMILAKNKKAKLMEENLIVGILFAVITIAILIFVAKFILQGRPVPDWSSSLTSVEKALNSLDEEYIEQTRTANVLIEDHFIQGFNEESGVCPEDKDMPHCICACDTMDCASGRGSSNKYCKNILYEPSTGFIINQYKDEDEGPVNYEFGLKENKGNIEIFVMRRGDEIINTIDIEKDSSPKSVDCSKDSCLPKLPLGSAWELVWEDDFNANNIDTTKWTVIGDEARRDGYWLKEDAYLENGKLVLRTKEENGVYSSGAIKSEDKFEHTFGYYEARMKFPEQEGHWPAFWLFDNNVNNVDDSGRDGTEVDIIEKPSTLEKIHQAIHWDGYEEDHKFDNNEEYKIPGINTGYHIVGLDWREDKYTFYVDGEKTWETSAGGVSQIPQFIFFSEEIGEWGGDIENANLPDYFYVDYVKVYDMVSE